MWSTYARRCALEARIKKYGPLDRAWGLRMKNLRGGRILAAHNPKHLADLSLKAPHVIAYRLRNGIPLESKRKYVE